jgi:hypothetical protein
MKDLKLRINVIKRGGIFSHLTYFEEESPYKPEAFNLRLFRTNAHGIAHKLLFYLIIFGNPISPLQTSLKFDFVF